MREILFRAKRKNWRELPKEEWWVYGDVIHEPIGMTIRHTEHGMSVRVPVDLETLCEYTGLKDKKGKRIWENDIVKHEVSDTIGTVKWYQEDYVGWCVDDIVIDEQQFTDEMWNECEVIGNIFDNPELLGQDGEES